MTETTAPPRHEETTTQTVSGEFGRIDIHSIPLPETVHPVSATFTPSGNVFVLYRTDGDPANEDWFHAAIVADDGSSFREIFSGPIPQKATANGIRHMPFTDNRRMLLGDYVLECTPSLDDCAEATLLMVEYPWNLTANPLVSHHWSEIIVSPDDQHIAWTILRTDMTANVALGRLQRGPSGYTIEDPAIISSSDALLPDPDRPGYFTTRIMRGGEVKQFVRGGTAISSVGDGGRALTDSVIQDLLSDQVEPITRTPGYDETTILSPDERLGIVMTTRASEQTDLAFIGLLPRPHATLVTMNLSWVLYLYAVDGVRRFRPGNIGPVLIDIHRSQTEPGYRGVPLNSNDSAWVYVSPMSWHPGGTKVAWIEMHRSPGADTDRVHRIRVAELAEYTAAAPVAAATTPTLPPYGITGDAAEDILQHRATFIPSGRIAGAASGYLDFERSSDGRGTSSASSRYVDYSDDGRSVYNGWERSSGSMTAGTVYEADIELTGEMSGEMRFRATWSGVHDGTRLLFGTAEDGRAQTTGFARYGDRIARLDELLP
ncbi:hypothetical protein ACX9R5_10870 [Rathayibacter sp. CAU 1779]